MRRIRILHSTQYQYTESVSLTDHKLHIRPREGHDLRIESSKLQIVPASTIFWHRDVLGNSVALAQFSEATEELLITSEVVVQHYEEVPPELRVEDEASNFPFHYNPIEQINLLPYLLSAFPENFPTLRDWMQGIWRSGQFIQTTELLHNLSARILADVGYQVREERGVQSPAETLTAGIGACRDMATLFIEACRYCGLAARFVSGYLLSEAAVVDYGSTHAWAEIYLPGTGWRGFDCTSGQWVSGDHIAVAVHRHPEAVPPISGGFTGSGSARSTMSVDVQVGVLAD